MKKTLKGGCGIAIVFSLQSETLDNLNNKSDLQL